MKSRLPFLTPVIAVLLGLAVLGSTVACVFPDHERGRGGEGRGGEGRGGEGRGPEHEHEHEMHHPD